MSDLENSKIQKIKNLLQALNFKAQSGLKNVYFKQYKKADNYAIEVDLNSVNGKINYGEKIKSERQTTANFSQNESLVVLECVDRLLEKGYQPQHIELEKGYKLGTAKKQIKGYLDILVTKDVPDAGKEALKVKPFMLIECKTWDKHEAELKRMCLKDGGQLFSYFQLHKAADFLMLYSSQLADDATVKYQNNLVKISQELKDINGDAKECYAKWNKQTNKNGIFEEDIAPYKFKPKALIYDDLEELDSVSSSRIFNHFLEILRHNVVSDKPNAFNKIFSLFLCKIKDEKNHDTTGAKRFEPLKFQWIYADDENENAIFNQKKHEEFQLKLADLYKEGMSDFLGKEITDFSENDLNKKLAAENITEIKHQETIRTIIRKLRLQKNNEFAIKDVFDAASFKENAQVLKEVVELLQNVRLHYSHKNQFLSNFFELLLTTGLKQEAGQFFTPIPVAQFILKSLPFDKMILQKLQQNQAQNRLPHIIDYASGSGHFLTEGMDLMQSFLEDLPNDPNFAEYGFNKDTSRFINSANEDKYSWAQDYIYGIEKDYRLVKVGKVGCYLNGDGLASVIHGDGLARFDHIDFVPNLNKKIGTNLSINTADLYKEAKNQAKDNARFDVVVSNPPYSVSGFAGAAQDYYGVQDFELYQYLTDQSSEIEALFIERTKHLLKDGGMAGIILPSSILSNTGIYTKARELVLKYFELIAVCELGSNTFMATGTNTVILFLRRRNNHIAINLLEDIKKSFINGLQNEQDLTINVGALALEQPIAKYLAHVWGEQISVIDYASLVKKNPNESIKKHEFYGEYRKKLFIDLAAKLRLKFKDEDKFLSAQISKLRQENSSKNNLLDGINEPNKQTPKVAEKIANLEQKRAELLKKIKEKEEQSELEFFERVKQIEQEKLQYFLLAQSQQKVVLISSGQKEVEKQFLGYEFSNRRGSEGIHPLQKGELVFKDLCAKEQQQIAYDLASKNADILHLSKEQIAAKAAGILADFRAGRSYKREIRISDCTKLFDQHSYTNPHKASFYVYSAFLGNFPAIDASLTAHISYSSLADMLTFDRADFDKLISTSVKKK